MDSEINISELIHRGGIFYNVKGKTPNAVYKNIAELIKLPEELTAEKVRTELCQREELMSTAVGHGIALPHPRYPLMKNGEEQRIIVCYLDTPILMNAPDSRPVYVMMVLLTSSAQIHLKILSKLAFLFQQPGFKSGLEMKPSEAELLRLIKNS